MKHTCKSFFTKIKYKTCGVFTHNVNVPHTPLGFDDFTRLCNAHGSTKHEWL